MTIRLVALLLLLSSCVKSDPWSLTTIQTKGLETPLSRLYYHTSDRVNGIDLEILIAQGKLVSFLQVHREAIPPLSKQPDKARGKLILEGQAYPFIAERHGGGQRLNLPEKSQDQIISLLKEGKSFTLQVDGYEEIIQPGEFSKKWNKIKENSYTIPFHLPF